LTQFYKVIILFFYFSNVNNLWGPEAYDTKNKSHKLKLENVICQIYIPLYQYCSSIYYNEVTL